MPNQELERNSKLDQEERSNISPGLGAARNIGGEADV